MIEIEQHLIGACVLAGSIEDATLSADDFASSDHQRIWAAVKSVDVVDQVTVLDALKDNRLAAYLSDLVVSVPSINNIAAYAERVKDYAVQRRLVRCCSEIVSMSQEAGSGAEKVAKAQAMLETVEAQKDEVDEFKGFVEYLDAPPTDLTGGYFDKYTGGIEHGLWVIAASTGGGKTAFALNLAINLLKHAPVTFYSYEMGTDQLMARMVSAKGSVSHDRLRDKTLDGNDWESIAKSVTYLKEKGMRVVDKSLDLDSLCAHIRQSVRKRGIRAAFVDYLQLVPSYGDSRVLEVANISRKLKQVSLDLKIPIFALSQLSRKHEERSNPRPRNSDLRESGSVEQDADVVLFLYDEAKLLETSNRKGITELFAGKNRHGELFSIPLVQELQFMRFGLYDQPLPAAAQKKKVDFRA